MVRPQVAQRYVTPLLKGVAVAISHHFLRMIVPDVQVRREVFDRRYRGIVSCVDETDASQCLNQLSGSLPG